MINKSKEREQRVKHHKPKEQPWNAQVKKNNLGMHHKSKEQPWDVPQMKKKKGKEQVRDQWV